MAILLLAGCAASQPAQTPKPASAPVAKATELTDIQVGGAGDTVQVVVTTSAKAVYSLVRQTLPPRLSLQLAGTRLFGEPKSITVDRGAVSVVKSLSAGTGSGVEILLSGEVSYTVEGRGASVVITINPKVPAPLAASEPGPAAGPVAAAAPEAPAAPAPSPEAAPAPEPAPAAEPPAPMAPAVALPAGRTLLAIEVEKKADGLVVVLKGDGVLAHEYFLVEGRSLVVDVAGVDNKVRPMKRKVGGDWVSQIRLGVHDQPKKATRVVFDLKKVGEYRVVGVEDRIIVSFGAPALAAAGSAAAPAAAVTALNKVGEITIHPLDAVTRVEIKTGVKADVSVVESGDPAKVILEIANAQIADADSRVLDLASQKMDLIKVSAFPYTRGDARLVRVIAQLRRPAPFRTVVDNDKIVVDFEKAPAAVAETSAAAAATSAAAAATPAAAAATSAAATETSAAATETLVAAPAAPPVVVVAAVTPAPTPAPVFGVFTGRRLSLDFKDADVNDILRLISEVSGLNFVAGPEVKGTVTIKLADVPWDQALEIILKTNVPQLAQVRESDNIVRITTADKILDEEQRRRRVEEDKKKTLDAQQALEPLVTKSYSISYAKAGDIKSFIEKSFSSERGKVLLQFDERTNTLVVQDLAARVAEIDRVIQSLDSPTPAVLVEARIVEVTSNFGQSIGVQWNAIGVKDAQHGNATQYAFPNSVSVGGQQGSGPAGAGNYLVNLPAAGAAGGIGMSFGHIANTLSLDLRLSAGESMGKVKVLSNPRVLVVQNQKAVINLGSQLPVPKTDSTGNRTVEWKDVGIKLEVQPQITNDKRVFLDINVEKSSQAPPVQTTEGSMFSISTSRAQSKVLIADGETTVIGGIFIQENSEGSDSVPGLAKIPLLGWLFKNKTNTDTRRELMIFLTPRIVVM